MADKNLTIKIKGDNAGLSRSLKQSKSGITKFGGFLKSFGSKFGLLGAGLVGTAAGGLGAGLTVKIFTGAIEEVDKLTKLGKQFGLTTEQVQKFEAVATLTGTNLQQLLKGFGQLSKSIVQFVRDGTGPGKKVFDDLGLSSETLSAAFKKGPIETLRVFGAALQKIENPLERSALLEELLGARNKELAVALQDVSKNFGEVDKTFKELDLGLTKEQTDAVELFRDTWAEIGFIIENKVLKSMSDLAATLQPIADAMLNLLENVIKGGLEGIGEALKKIGALINTIGGPAFQALLSGNPLGRAVQAGGLGLQAAGATLAGDLDFDNVRATFARGLTGAFDMLEVPPSFGQKIVAAVRGSNLEEVLPGLAAPAAGTGTVNGRRIVDIMADIQRQLAETPAFPGMGTGPAAGTGTINGRSIEGILKESQKQTTALDKLNQIAEKSFFRNERTGVQTAVAAP